MDFIVKVPIPDGQDPVLQNSFISTKSNGAFLFSWSQNSGNSYCIAVKPNKDYFYFQTYAIDVKSITNVISMSIESGVPTIIQDEIDVLTQKSKSKDLILKTLSDSGYISLETAYISYKTNRMKYSQISPQKLFFTNVNETISKIAKYNRNGNNSEEIIINTSLINISNERQTLNSYDGNIVIVAEKRNRDLLFYRLNDSDIFSQNRIELNPSQSGSIKATVNNPEQALLNIQSSTNLIDWNTFKTIKNEPTFEIVVPANKPKEFIRVIE